MKKCIKYIVIIFVFASLFAVSTQAISNDHWAVDYVDFCYNNEIITTTRSNFVDTIGTRKEFVLYLMRLDGYVPGGIELNSVSPVIDFSDMPSESHYAMAIRWAVSNGIVNGYPDGTFKPDNPILRQDMTLALYRYITQNCDYSFDPYTPADFVDYDDVSPYARAAVNAFYNAGVINGDGGYFDPLENAPTSHMMCFFTLIHGFMNNSDYTINVYVKTESGTPVQNAAVVHCLYESEDSYNDNTVYQMTDADGFSVQSCGDGTYYYINVFTEDMSSFYPECVTASRLYRIVTIPNNLYDYELINSYTDRSNLWPHINGCCKENREMFGSWCPTALMDSGQNLGWRYNGGIEFHQGIDCGGGGEEIKNTTGFDMIVVGVSTEDTPYGYYVKIRLSGTNYYLIYQHLSQINVGINQTIAAGSNQIIAYTGGTGGVDPHLHLTLTTDSQLMFSTNPTIIKQFYDPRIIFK